MQTYRLVLPVIARLLEHLPKRWMRGKCLSLSRMDWTNSLSRPCERQCWERFLGVGRLHVVLPPPLAWQRRSEFPERGIKDGDAVLVLCAETDALRFSLIVARQDRRLAEERPESGGIFWERRPAIAADEYGESLGLRDIWRDYANRLFNEGLAELSKGRNDRYREDLLSYSSG